MTVATTMDDQAFPLVGPYPHDCPSCGRAGWVEVVPIDEGHDQQACRACGWVWAPPLAHPHA